jgi:hypothetical protein
MFKTGLLLAFGWNFYLVFGVIANQSYAFERAAGGQFDSFPIGIRIAYLLNLSIVIYQALILFGRVKARRIVIRSLFILGVLSVLVNAFSQSPLERWNAIPAALIAYAFFRELKKKN